MAKRCSSYAEFWPVYLGEHSRPGTRRLHFIGTALTLPLIAAAAITLDWRWLLAAAFAGYGFAWAAHLLIERNRPATFTHPLWSLISDYRMFFLWVSGRLSDELRRCGLSS